MAGSGNFEKAMVGVRWAYIYIYVFIYAPRLCTQLWESLCYILARVVAPEPPPGPPGKGCFLCFLVLPHSLDISLCQSAHPTHPLLH